MIWHSRRNSSSSPHSPSSIPWRKTREPSATSTASTSLSPSTNPISCGNSKGINTQSWSIHSRSFLFSIVYFNIYIPLFFFSYFYIFFFSILVLFSLFNVHILPSSSQSTYCLIYTTKIVVIHSHKCESKSEQKCFQNTFIQSPFCLTKQRKK